jgi:thiosulfate dehydrogenase [quinone] large subunit
MSELKNDPVPGLYSTGQLIALVLLRMLIGWQFLYEGLTKLLDPLWSSAGYLITSRGIFSGIFHAIAANPTFLKIVDVLNIWALILIGVGLLAGILSGKVAMSGIVLLVIYYLSHPPFFGLTSSLTSEGTYLLVNNTLIELGALIVLYFFPTGKYFGLDIFLGKFLRREKE